MPSQVLIKGRDAAYFVERLAQALPDLHVRGAADPAEALATCADAEILVIRTDEIFAELIDAMPKLRLIQALTTGTDHIQALPNLPAHVLLAAARGFHGPQMSELAFVFMLHFVRDFRGLFATQAAHRWNRVEQRLLAGQTAVIVGVGAIAEELAKRCVVFGMRVLGVSDGRLAAPHFEAIYPRARLTDAATQADFLIALVPHTPETDNLIGAAVFEAMKRSAVLINLARGGVVDEDALIAALGRGTIAGAGLDVFRVEPLPADSPLWDMPNVFITSHVGGMADSYGEQVMPLLIDNLRAFAQGQPDKMRFIVKRTPTASGGFPATT
ncbi:MAG: D-2-hydroxyacid dehydrogenase [Hyphomicrobiales bacterium]|nr:D-2-hydroxyacid dehydrogenase [Hyphomicrobiales bacterium]